MTYFVVVLDKPVTIDGELVEVIGPFRTLAYASQWFKSHLPEGSGEIKSVYLPKDHD